MILDRPLELWNRLVVAAAALAVVIAVFVAPDVDVTQLVGAVVAVAYTILALLANKSETGSILGRYEYTREP